MFSTEKVFIACQSINIFAHYITIADINSFNLIIQAPVVFLSPSGVVSTKILQIIFYDKELTGPSP